jgi:hypothetical protein
VHCTLQEPEVSGEKKIILKFITGTQGMPQKSPKVGVAATAGPSAIFDGIEMAARSS